MLAGCSTCAYVVIAFAKSLHSERRHTDLVVHACSKLCSLSVAAAEAQFGSHILPCVLAPKIRRLTAWT